MSLLRSAVIQRVREMADAVGATRNWPVDLVLLFADTAYDTEWAALLDQVPFYRTAFRALTAGTADADAGGVALIDLDSGTGATQQRTYRVLQVLRNGQALAPVDPWQLQLQTDATSASPGDGVFAMTDQLLTIPGLASGDAVTVLLNHRPALVSTLTDADAIVWPDGADIIPLAETAALMLAGKGGQQPGEADTLSAIAERQRQALYSRLERRTGGVRQLTPGGSTLLTPQQAAIDFAGWSSGY